MPQTSKLTFFFSILFLLFTILFISKAYDHAVPRGVVIADTLPLYISPTDQDIKITELSQGSEVIIDQSRTDWIQVKTMNGNWGWTQKKHIFQTSGALVK